MRFNTRLYPFPALQDAKRLRSAFRIYAAISLCTVLMLLGTLGCGSRVALTGPLVINSFTATPATISTGQSTTLVWSVTIAAASLTINDGVSNLTGSQLTPITSNSVSVTPTAPVTTYTLTATDSKGNTQTATVTVTIVPSPVITSFTATPTLIAAGQTSTLNWVIANGNPSIGCNTSGCGFSGNGSGTPVTGTSIQVSPQTTTVYNLFAVNAAGASVFTSVTVNVVPAPTINFFKATQALIGNGQCTALNWSVSGPTTSIAIDNNVGSVGSSGSTSVCPTQTTTYNLTATNVVNSFPATVTASATVTVSATPPPFISSFTATPPSVGPGGTVTLNWTVLDATTVTIECITPGCDLNGSGTPITVTGNSITVMPASSTTYELQATNSLGSATPAQLRVLAGNVALVAGQPGSPGYLDNTIGAQAQFYNPNGIAVDASGNIYVADTVNNVIRLITPTGTVSTFAGNPGTAGTGNPGIAGSNDGPTQCGGKPACAEFNAPQGVAVDSLGNVYVTDTLNNTIRMITPAGVVSTIAGVVGQSASQNIQPGLPATFSNPIGIAVDSVGNLYISDAGTHSILKITTPGATTSVVSVLAGPGQYGAHGCINGVGSAAEFFFPIGVAVDSNQNVYVADTINNVIREITPLGSVSTIAGACGNTSGHADGDGPTASFFSPSGVAVDTAGNIYVTDTNNDTIRRISSSPNGAGEVVTTIIGQVGKQDPTLAGGPLPAKIEAPSQIAVDPISGNLFFTVYNNNTAADNAIMSAPY